MTRVLPWVFVSALPLALASAGCPTASPPPPPEPPTWHDDVAPIFATQCQGCHRVGGMAPTPLSNYAEARVKASLIAPYVQLRLMPPWNFDNSGDCQTYHGARWLSDDEIETILAWINADTPEGDPRSPPEVVAESVSGSSVETGMLEPYQPIPSAEHPDDDYRCFLIDAPAATDSFLTAFQVLPGEPLEVHHIVLFSLPSEATAQSAQRLDDKEDGPGYTCFGSPGVSAFDVVAGWTPGKPVMRYPEGTGIRLPGGRKLVMQVHYNLQAKSDPDQTRLRMETTTTVAKEASLWPLIDFNFSLPPGEFEVSHTFETSFSDLRAPVDVLGWFPHMHTLGDTIRMEKIAGDPDDDACMGDVPRWDFHWQELAFYEEPLTLTPQDAVALTCTWDTSDRTETTTFGEGTQDEMCVAFLYVVEH